MAAPDQKEIDFLRSVLDRQAKTRPDMSNDEKRSLVAKARELYITKNTAPNIAPAEPSIASSPIAPQRADTYTGAADRIERNEQNKEYYQKQLEILAEMQKDVYGKTTADIAAELQRGQEQKLSRLKSGGTISADSGGLALPDTYQPSITKRGTVLPPVKKDADILDIISMTGKATQEALMSSGKDKFSSADIFNPEQSLEFKEFANSGENVVADFYKYIPEAIGKAVARMSYPTKDLDPYLEHELFGDDPKNNPYSSRFARPGINETATDISREMLSDVANISGSKAVTSPITAKRLLKLTKANPAALGDIIAAVENLGEVGGVKALEKTLVEAGGNLSQAKARYGQNFETIFSPDTTIGGIPLGETISKISPKAAGRIPNMGEEMSRELYRAMNDIDADKFTRDLIDVETAKAVHATRQNQLSGFVPPPSEVSSSSVPEVSEVLPPSPAEPSVSFASSKPAFIPGVYDEPLHPSIAKPIEPTGHVPTETAPNVLLSRIKRPQPVNVIDKRLRSPISGFPPAEPGPVQRSSPHLSKLGLSPEDPLDKDFLLDLSPEDLDALNIPLGERDLFRPPLGLFPEPPPFPGAKDVRSAKSLPDYGLKPGETPVDIEHRRAADLPSYEPPLPPRQLPASAPIGEPLSPLAKSAQDIDVQDTIDKIVGSVKPSKPGVLDIAPEAPVLKQPPVDEVEEALRHLEELTARKDISPDVGVEEARELFFKEIKGLNVEKAKETIFKAAPELASNPAVATALKEVFNSTNSNKFLKLFGALYRVWKRVKLEGSAVWTAVNTVEDGLKAFILDVSPDAFKKIDASIPANMEIVRTPGGTSYTREHLEKIFLDAGTGESDRFITMAERGHKELKAIEDYTTAALTAGISIPVSKFERARDKLMREAFIIDRLQKGRSPTSAIAEMRKTFFDLSVGKFNRNMNTASKLAVGVFPFIGYTLRTVPQLPKFLAGSPRTMIGVPSAITRTALGGDEDYAPRQANRFPGGTLAGAEGPTGPPDLPFVLDRGEKLGFGLRGHPFESTFFPATMLSGEGGGLIDKKAVFSSINPLAQASLRAAGIDPFTKEGDMPEPFSSREALGMVTGPGAQNITNAIHLLTTSPESGPTPAIGYQGFQTPVIDSLRERDALLKLYNAVSPVKGHVILRGEDEAERVEKALSRVKREEKKLKKVKARKERIEDEEVRKINFGRGK